MHVSSCIWYTLTRSSQKWVILPNYIYPYTEEQYSFFTSSTWRKLLMSMYNGFFLSTDGEIVPRVKAEFFQATFILLLGQVFYSYIMGEVSYQQGELGADDVDL